MDCIIGYHLNPMRCGVAKFNAILAARLAVPIHALFDDACLRYRQPLISLKIDELSDRDLDAFGFRLGQLRQTGSYRVFLHSYTGTDLEQELVTTATKVYCGNTQLCEELRPVRPDVQELWAPGMIEVGRRFNHSELSVFSFGMAHKVRTEHYRRLQALLDATGTTYSLYISTALHESSTFDDEFGAAFQELQSIFGDRTHFLGYLSDSAVYNYLLDSTYYAAFFDQGVRGNNTSVNAAIEIGCVVITNLDAHSPSFFVHGENVLDVGQVESLPTDPTELGRIRACARALGREALSWDALTARISSLEDGASPARRQPWLTSSSR